MSLTPNHQEPMEEAHSEEQFYLQPRPSTSSQQTFPEARNQVAERHLWSIANYPMQNIVYNPPYHFAGAFSGASTSFNPHIDGNENNFYGHGLAAQSLVMNLDDNKPKAVIKPIYYPNYSYAVADKTISMNEPVSDAAKQAILKNTEEKPKRVRTVFTQEQKDKLDEEYKLSRYIDQRRRLIIARSLNLTEKTVKVWFQNQRMKDKKDIQNNDQEIQINDQEHLRGSGMASDDDEEVKSLSSSDSNQMQLDDGYQIPSNYQPSMMNHLHARGLLRNRYLSCSSSTGYSNCLEPLEEVSTDFDSETSCNATSPVANLTSLTVNLIPNPTETENNVPTVIETTPSPPNNEETEVSNLNSFTISRYMNLDE